MLDLNKIQVNTKAHLKCAVCGEEYPLELRYRCQSCDDGVLNVVYSTPQTIKSGSGLERFEDFVPIQPMTDFYCPESPLVQLKNPQYLDHNGVYCKVEGNLATGNTKYRQSCMATPGLL